VLLLLLKGRECALNWRACGGGFSLAEAGLDTTARIYWKAESKNRKRKTNK
jgi:hypothetical protein